MRSRSISAIKYERIQSESEGLRVKKKLRRKRMVRGFLLTVGLGAGFGLVGFWLQEVILAEMASGKVEPVAERKTEAKVEISDESGLNYVTERMRVWVNSLEQELRGAGLLLERVVVPNGKTRELDVYLKDRNEYYKCSLDRGAAETMEDITRMKKYLDDRELKAKYVDVRLEEQAYYL